MDGVTGSCSENKGIMRVLDKREIVKDLDDSCRGNMEPGTQKQQDLNLVAIPINTEM